MASATAGESVDIAAWAVQLCGRINVRELEARQRLAVSPLTVAAGSGLAVLQRYGAVVFFGVGPAERETFLAALQPHATAFYPRRECEELCVHVDPEAREGLEGNTLSVQDRSLERLQVIADVLSKSVALARYEALLADSFDQIEPLATSLEKVRAFRSRERTMLQHLGSTLLSEQEIVARIEIAEKPDLVWDRPDLDRLYMRLEDEFELRERYAAIDRKLQLIARTSQTVLNLIQHRHSLRVEWYIIALIAFEIVLTLYEYFVRHSG